MPRVTDILQTNNFRFNHNLGQNFITDGNLLGKIVSEAGVEAGDTVVEIGTGAGTLTAALASACNKVYSFEVDRNLRPVLDETLSGLDNVEVIFKDVLKMKDSEIYEIVGNDYKVVANIPYYITTPLIMRFLEGESRPKSITVMVQKEVAERLVAKNDTAEYGAITMAIGLYGDAKIVGTVDKKMFYPVPKVDSCIVRIDLNNRYDCVDKKLIGRLIKCAFGMRRKTLVNNLAASFNISKPDAEKIVSDGGFDVRIRGEALSLDDIIRLSHNELLN